MKITPYKIIKGIRYLKHYGPKAFFARLQDKMEPDKVPYAPWFEHHRADEATLRKQRKESERFKIQPKISIVVPCYKTPERYLIEMMDSVREQSYSNWELCLADATPSSEVEKAVCSYLEQEKEERIVYRHLEENLGIAGNTNVGLENASGDWVALLDHDDLLAKDALFEIVKKINEDERYGAVYTDEDKIEEQKGELVHSQPHFKPDFSIDLLRSNNYITHFFCVKKSIVEQQGGFRSEFEGAQDYDFILRCTESTLVGHVPRILYHWRLHSSSTADNPLSKRYAYDAGQRAIEQHLKRCGEEGEVSQLKFFGFYQVTYKTKGTPLISIVIPNKDETKTLQRCIESLQQTDYTNYEVIIVENNSVSEEIFAYYGKLCGEDYREGRMCLSCSGTLPGGQSVQVVTWKGDFNYSAINNFGVSFAKGTYIAFLNNDIEVLTRDWAERLLGNCQRERVGIVGTRLYYPDNTYQHAGIVVGIDGIAANMYPGMRREREGYLHKAALQLNYSAVTAAFLMVKRSVFEKIGGFEEKLAVAFNDVDLCLRAREAGYLVVYDPYVEAYHYESKSRGKEDTKEKIKRFEGEIEFFRTRWISFLKKGDPYYNPNFSLKKCNYALKPYKD
ncbi:MAG: glycosyltransferase family 2 protein [Lachnospiraceae bacterium]|nr:glycosyltransferase family 2 protein [Lachnospiraceae bacterium]